MISQQQMLMMVQQRITQCNERHFEIDVNQYGIVSAMKGYCKAKDLRVSHG